MRSARTRHAVSADAIDTVVAWHTREDLRSHSTTATPRLVGAARTSRRSRARRTGSIMSASPTRGWPCDGGRHGLRSRGRRGRSLVGGATRDQAQPARVKLTGMGPGTVQVRAR